MYNGIVLSGGGIKGYMQLGALSYHLPKLKSKPLIYAGTSIGSAICFLLALGHDPHAILKYLHEYPINFETRLTDIWTSVNKSMGLLDISILRKHISDFCIKHHGRDTFTFADIHNQYGVHLCIVATNLTHGSQTVYSYTSSPLMNVIDAVVQSCGIPFVFKQILDEQTGCWMADGALVNNYPWSVIYPDISACNACCHTKINLLGMLTHDIRTPKYPGYDAITLETYIKTCLQIALDHTGYKNDSCSSPDLELDTLHLYIHEDKTPSMLTSDMHGTEILYQIGRVQAMARDNGITSTWIQ